MDIRQWPEWGKFMESLGWKNIKVGKNQMFVRNIPFINRSVIKFQRPFGPIDFGKLDILAKEYQALFLLFEPDKGIELMKQFKQHRFTQSKMSAAHSATTRIDISPPESEIFKSFSENARRNILKARSNKLIVEAVDLSLDKGQVFDEFMGLLTNLVKLKKFYAPSSGEFYKKYQAFKKISYIFFAFNPNQPQKPIAAVWLAKNFQQVSYLHTGITKDGYEKLANYLLVWQSIKFFKKLGCLVYDFEGIYDPRFPKERQSWAKFTEFKKRFHGEIIEFPQSWIKCYSLWFKLIYLCGTTLSR